MKDQASQVSAALTRRQIIAGAATGAGAGLFGMSVKGAGTLPDTQSDPTRVQGAPPSPVGSRAPGESPKRKPVFGVVSLTPLEQLQGTITPADLHFERHHAGIPAIDRGRHELLLHGFVDRPLKWRLDDLMRYPSGAGISDAPAASRLGRQHEREVAAPPGSYRQPVDGAR